jgi:hypothetical protein
MRKQWIPIAMLAVAAAVASGESAFAQIDLGASFYRTFNGSTSGNGTSQTPTDSYGGILEARQIRSPLVGYEFNFSLNPENTTFAPMAPCGYVCENKTTDLTVKALETGIDWIASLKTGTFRPFLLGGMGAFVSVPNGSVIHTNTVPRPAYVGGGGVDIGFQSRLGVRVQYRESFYKAPDLLPVFPPTGKYTQTGMPIFGLYWSLTNPKKTR